MILVGAGGHALSLAEIGTKIFGYLAGKANSALPGIWLGTDENIQEALKLGLPFHIAFIYTGLPVMSKRKEIIDSYEKSEAQFASILSPKAIITPSTTLGKGCAVMAGAIINRASIGNHVVVNSGAIVEHDCIIGHNTFIGPGAVIGGFTSIGENCFIGLGARIGNGLKIASNVSVAMGAVVNRDLTESGIYHGNPLRLHKLKK